MAIIMSEINNNNYYVLIFLQYNGFQMNFGLKTYLKF